MPKKKSPPIVLFSEHKMDALICDLADQLGPDQTFELITQLDAEQMDWDLTIRLYEHFTKLKLEYDKEVAENP